MVLILTEDKKARPGKIEYIYDKFRAYMTFVAFKELEDKSYVDDAVQTSVIKMIKVVDAIDISDETRLKNFCQVVTRNTAIDINRKLERVKIHEYSKRSPDDCFEYTLPIPEDLLVSKDICESIVDIIREMDDTYRDVCILRFVNGLSYKEISALLNISEKSVSVKIHRGKAIIKNKLKKDGLYEQRDE